MPQLPAVGVATIRPMEALQPATDRARAMAWSMMVPDRPPWGPCRIVVHFPAFSAGESGSGALVFLFSEFYCIGHYVQISGHFVEQFFRTLFHGFCLVCQDQFADFLSAFFPRLPPVQQWMYR